MGYLIEQEGNFRVAWEQRDVGETEWRSMDTRAYKLKDAERLERWIIGLSLSDFTEVRHVRIQREAWETISLPLSETCKHYECGPESTCKYWQKALDDIAAERVGSGS